MGVGISDAVYPSGAPRIASDFGSWEGINGGERETQHQGIDITGKSGQPILAAANGTVLEATVEQCWGPTIAVDHGEGIDGKKNNSSLRPFRQNVGERR